MASNPIPQIISVDDHVVEPPTLWSDRLPARYQETGPRVVRAGMFEIPKEGSAKQAGKLVPTEDGEPCDWWFYEDKMIPVFRSQAAAGFKAEPGDRAITFEQMRPGCYDPKARLDDMSQNGVEASLCFPNMVTRFCGQTFLEAQDKELALLCVRAYNDWMVEEWAGPSGGRLIPLCIVPLWDAELAAAEVRRNAARGVRAVTFSEMPPALGLPSIHDRDHYWGPFLAACEETGTVICLHIGSSSRMPVTSTDAPMAVSAVLLSCNSLTSLTDWLFSGNFERYPNLKIAYSEGGIGWIPFVLERADHFFAESTWMYDPAKVRRKPSEYYRDHVYGCFISDHFGVRSIEAVGEDNVTFEVDYPHNDSTWPYSLDCARRELAGLTEEQILKVVRGNAIRLFGLDLPLVRA